MQCAPVAATPMTDLQQELRIGSICEFNLKHLRLETVNPFLRLDRNLAGLRVRQPAPAAVAVRQILVTNHPTCCLQFIYLYKGPLKHHVGCPDILSLAVLVHVSVFATMNRSIVTASAYPRLLDFCLPFFPCSTFILTVILE